MDAFAIPQAATCGAIFTGLAAQVTGTDAANDVVADFTGATATQLGTPSVATPVTHNASITLGSRFHINIEGIWVVKARISHITASSVRAAIGVDNAPGDLSIDPVVPNGSTFLDTALSIQLAADTSSIEVESDPFIITRAQAQDQVAQATGNVRLLLSNNAGAGAADASIGTALTFIKFQRIGDVPSQLRG